MKKICIAIVCSMLLSGSLMAQAIPSPKEFFGFGIGDDYQLANFTQTEAYFKKLAASPRTKYVDIGLTEEGRHQFMLVISSPENIKNLERYRTISQKMAHAEGLTDDEAHQLSVDGKVVVWIDGGLHATEVVGIHQLIETSYQLVTRNDEETKKILDKDIILMVHANPDGQELISNWYMKEKDPQKRNMNVPRLWEKYVGHDNNRDSYMMNMKESQNITRQQFLEWIPQIVYNHHQAGPAGSVVAGPPFRDPFNYLYDPLLMTSIDEVGSAMNSRLNAEGKPGYTQRSGTEFSTWFNGGVRTATYFHNTVGLLTEIIGTPAPSTIPVVPERLIPNSATPFPILPQTWHFRQSIDYSLSLNYAVLNYAARHSDELLYNMYRMGKNSIERGSKDYWTLSPKRSDAIVEAAKAGQPAVDSAAGGARGSRGGAPGAVTIGGARNGNIALKYYDAVLKNPELRDPRGYIISVDQPDFATAVKFVNLCIRSGLIVQKATTTFTVNGKNYPAGSYIVKTNQAFRPEVLDRFEPENHPNDFLYPGGPPIKPYDMTGWTVAYQMGIKFDRILDDFNGPFQRIPYGQLQPMPLEPTPSVAKNGYYLSASANNSFIAVNDLLKAGAKVYRLKEATTTEPAGTFYVAYSAQAKPVLDNAAKNLGVSSKAAVKKPSAIKPIAAARIALWDQYGGSMPSGWTRWMMEQYHFPFKVVYPQEFDAGDLKSKFDVIIFVGGAIPAPGREGGNLANRGGRGGDIPDEFKTWTGRITVEKTVPQLKTFLEAGGTVITVGTSANLAYDLNLPVHNALTDNVNGNEVPFPGDKFYIPGTILRASIDTKQPANYGMEDQVDVMFDSSPAFKLDADAAEKGVKPLMWFSTDKPLRSGWAWGQQYLKDDVAAFSAQVGAGMLYSFGPEITFRGQPHGTFKLLFNELYAKSTTK
jgi:hypothetical protein